jgi:hypothetical protein
VADVTRQREQHNYHAPIHSTNQRGHIQMTTKLEEIDAATDTPVLGNIPPSLHPRHIGGILARETKQGERKVTVADILVSDDSPAMTDAYKASRLAARELYNGLALLEHAELTVRQEHATGKVVNGKNIVPEISEEAKVTLKAAMEIRCAKTAAAFDNQLNVVKDATTTLNAAIATKLKYNDQSATTASAASDIRGYIKSLPQGERAAFCFKAADENDLEIISAVLTTTPFVSGLTRQEIAMVRDHASKILAPREYMQRHALSKISEGLTVAGDSYMRRFQEILPRSRPSSAAAAMAALKS